MVTDRTPTCMCGLSLNNEAAVTFCAYVCLNSDVNYDCSVLFCPRAVMFMVSAYNGEEISLCVGTNHDTVSLYAYTECVIGLGWRDQQLRQVSFCCAGKPCRCGVFVLTAVDLHNKLTAEALSMTA